MRDVLIITAREIRDKKLLFLGAALCALIVLATPLLPGARSEHPLDVMTTAALVLCLIFLLAAPLVLGAGVIAGDLQERRMSFYFARPVNAIAIWSGKTLATILIALGLAGTVVLVPTLLGKGLLAVGNYASNVKASSPWASILMEAPFRNFLLLSLLLLALAQFWGLGLRTRSPWLLLDVASFGVVGTMLWLSIRPFLLNDADPEAVRMTVIAAIALTVLLLAGTAAGLHAGRSDLDRTHQWTSITAAGLLLIGAAGLAGYSHNARSLAPDEFAYSELLDSGGSWIAVAGRREGRWNSFSNTFLINLDGSEQIEVTNSMPLIADGGEVAALWRRDGIDPPSATLHWIDLDRPREIRDTRVSIPLNQSAWGYVYWPNTRLSPSGRHVAWIEEDAIQVYGLQSETTVFSARLPAEQLYRVLLFSDDLTLQVFTRPQSDDYDEWTIRAVDLERRAWSVTGSLPRGRLIKHSSDLIRMLPEEKDPAAPRRYELRSIRDGSVVAAFTAERGGFLHDGRFASFEGNTLRVIGRGGETDTTIEIPTEETVSGLTELAPNVVALFVPRDRDLRDSVVYVADLRSSEVRLLDPRVRRVVAAQAGRPNRRTIVGDGRHLFLLDPETLTTRRITGGE